MDDERFWGMADTSGHEPFGPGTFMIVDEQAGGVIAYAVDEATSLIIVTALRSHEEKS